MDENDYIIGNGSGSSTTTTIVAPPVYDIELVSCAFVPDAIDFGDIACSFTASGGVGHSIVSEIKADDCTSPLVLTGVVQDANPTFAAELDEASTTQQGSIYEVTISLDNSAAQSGDIAFCLLTDVLDPEGDTYASIGQRIRLPVDIDGSFNTDGLTDGIQSSVVINSIQELGAMDENDYNHYSRSSSSENSDMASFPAGGILFFTVTILFVGILTWQAVCKVCRKSCGCCPERDYSDDPDHRGADGLNDEDMDRMVAMALQRQLNEEASDRNRMAKRKERRMWYLYYLRPFTMTVTQSDLIHEHKIDGDSSTQDESDEDGTITVQTGSQQASEDRSDDDNDNEDTIDLEDGESQAVCLRLPASTGGRCVDGTCALCLDDYCVGDEVVWSSCPECKHVFHKECFLSWLSKGKKRCPICRNWFVPGQKIDDQKILHGKAWTDALAEMVRAEKEDIARAEAAKRQQELEQQQQEEEAVTLRESNQEPGGSSTSTSNNNDDPEQDSRFIKTTNSSRSCGTASGSEDSEQFCDCNRCDCKSNDSSP